MARFFNAQVPEAVQGGCLSDAERSRELKRNADRQLAAPPRTARETMRGIARRPRRGRDPQDCRRRPAQPHAAAGRDPAHALLAVRADRRGYRATTAHALAYERASRPKPAKLATNLALRAVAQDNLNRRYSPKQIAGRLRRRFLMTRRCGCPRRRSTQSLLAA